MASTAIYLVFPPCLNPLCLKFVHHNLLQLWYLKITVPLIFHVFGKPSPLAFGSVLKVVIFFMFHIPVHKRLGVCAISETVADLVTAMESSWENLKWSACLKKWKLLCMFCIQLSPETLEVCFSACPSTNILSARRKRFAEVKIQTCVQLQYRKLSVQHRIF